jgi:hypothetical protein
VTGNLMTNRPDVPTGERMMRGHRVPTYPHNAVTHVERPQSWIRTPGYVTVIGPHGSRATMTIEACHATCYLAPGAIVAGSLAELASR